jgi:hypothetical protein
MYAKQDNRRKGEIMLRQLIVITTLALSAQLAQAAEAGKIIFVAGKAEIADRAAALNTKVQEGDMLTTGADGFMYVKTIDNGLFILRPNTKARIAAYHVDVKNPANTRIKLELLGGVARSLSGEAVKLARQNFRFNTPVAAIGVRGTDFTVFTDQDTSRVAVISGGIVMSGFVGACRPEGSGPCEGNASRELSAAQRGQLLQVQRGQSAPQLLTGGALSPDQVSPPRGDEPLAKLGANSGTSAIADTSLDAKKSDSLAQITAKPAAEPTDPVVTPTPIVVTPPAPIVVTPPVPGVPVVVTPPVVLPERQILWGRFQPVLDQPATVSLADQRAAGNERVAVQGKYALFRTPGKDYVAPEHGSVGFALQGGEAYISNRDTTVPIVAAKVENGQLTVDFGKATFATSFDLVGNNELFKLKADGTVSKDGRLFGNGQNSRVPNMDVDGVLSNANGGSAAYLFKARLDQNSVRTVQGVTYWGH